jgi:uncharacterized DUF497 family protein
VAATFDPKKDEANRAKHGIGLGRFDDMVDRWLVAARPGPEPRALVLGRIDGRLWTAVITWRTEGIRVISLRPARRTERKEHERVYPSSA